MDTPAAPALSPVKKRRGFRAWSTNPLAIAGAWLLASLEGLLRQYQYGEFPPRIEMAVGAPSIALVCGLALGAWLGSRANALRHARMLLSLLCAVLGVMIVADALTGSAFQADGFAIVRMMLALMIWFIAWAQLKEITKPLRARVVAFFSGLVFLLALSWPAIVSQSYWMLAPLFIDSSDDEPASRVYEIEQDRLWGAQPGLVDQALAKAGPKPDAVQTIVVGLAADGSMELFSREAALAVDVIGRRYAPGNTARALLSNTESAILEQPFATRSNFGQMLARVTANKPKGSVDIVVYIAGHGSADGEVATRLPTYDDMQPISGQWLRTALDRAGIGKRTIIVSACYAGTWIDPLASPDTIVVAAAAKDRTSFGCDDSRRLTVFGEALLEGPLAKGASWHAAFAATRRRVQSQERAMAATPSRPTVSIGGNMTSLWEDIPAKR